MKLYARLAAAAAFVFLAAPRRPPTNCRTCWARAAARGRADGRRALGFKDAKGEAAGLDIDLARLMAADMGVKLELVQVTGASASPACWPARSTC